MFLPALYSHHDAIRVSDEWFMLPSIPSQAALPAKSTLALGIATLMLLCGCGSGVKLATSSPPSPLTAVSAGPQLGYAWNAQDQTLRPILGVAGSSQVGQSVVPAGAYINAVSSSPANLALLIGADQQVYRMALPGGSPAQIGVKGSAATRIRFSPSGTAALLYAPGSQTATILTNLVSGPQIRQLSVSSPLLDLAVSDAGSAVAILQSGSESGSSASVTLLSSSGAQPLLTVGAPGGLSFAGTSDNLVVADASANTLTLIRSASSTPTPLQLPTASLLKSPLGVGTSLNGQWVAVANSADSSIVRIDLTGATAPQRVACPAQPALVAQLSGNGVFRFTDLSTAPVWIADVTASTPAMLFIPPAAQ
jgi:hypothetical protein